MTRYPRRRSRSRTLDGSPFRAPFALGISLAENPNRGKRKLTYPVRVRLEADAPRVKLRRIPTI